MVRGIKFCGGYPHFNHSNGTKVSELIDSMAWETGYWKPASSENGVMQKMVAFRRCCSATGILGWGKPTLGRRAHCIGKDNAGVANEWQIIAP